LLRSTASVIVPAFNEVATIDRVLFDTMSVMDSTGLAYEIIVVDDGSTDSTLQRVTNHKVRTLSNGTNHGKGYSMRRGFAEAHGDIIITMDSDGAHDPKEIPALIAHILNGADMVSGSRFLGEGKHFTRKINAIGNFLINMTIMLLTRKRITDSQTGFRAFSNKFLKAVTLESHGFEIEAEITVKGLKNGFTFKEVPIYCSPRKYSASRLNILSDSIKIFRTILKSNLTKKPHK
jgi:glycosyltransferase involved in cell wall biosynthesis